MRDSSEHCPSVPERVGAEPHAKEKTPLAVSHWEALADRYIWELPSEASDTTEPVEAGRKVASISAPVLMRTSVRRTAERAVFAAAS
jgi:hypothetical protein